MNVALAVALFSQVPGGPDPLPRKTWFQLREWLREAEDASSIRRVAADLLGQDDRAEVDVRLDRLAHADEWLSNLSESGIRAVTEFDEEYPQRWCAKLGNHAPPLCFLAGDSGSLSLSAVAVVGSREAPDDCLTFTEAIGQACASRGLAVVSGGARGVDSIAMNSGFEAGGCAIGVLSDSMLRAVRGQTDRLSSGRLLLLCPYSPEAGFSVGGAMGRNKLVYALADAAIVVHATLGAGGTWAGAKEALDDALCPVGAYVACTESAGALALVQYGARPIASVAEVFGLSGDRPGVQPSLFS